MTKKTTNKKAKTTKSSTQKHPQKNNKKPANKKKNKKTTLEPKTRKINKKVTIVIVLLLGVLLTFSTYAWFSTNLNVKIKTFRMLVSKNSDLTISFDGVDFTYSLEINKDTIYNDIGKTYPSHTNQYAGNGFIPVSSPGIPNANTSTFDVFESSGILYARRDTERKHGFYKSNRCVDDEPREYNKYLAFDIFIKNETGSPVSDNLYLDTSTIVRAVDEDISEEMLGLVNSFRIGIVRVGSVGLKATVNEIQSISCNNQCEQVIYEPNSKNHTALAIERASIHNAEVVDGFDYPTYANKKAGGPIYVKDSIAGNVDPEYFELQETIDDIDIVQPIFKIPDGITKFRIYVWIEGQDIDSLETHSTGAEVEIGIDFIKDTEGYEAVDE